MYGVPVRPIMGRALRLGLSFAPHRLVCHSRHERFPGGSVLPDDWLTPRVYGTKFTMRITGIVKFYNSSKGFGFIQPQDGSKDVFVHATALELAGIRSLQEGDKVSFVLEDDRKGRGKQAGQLEQA